MIKTVFKIKIFINHIRIGFIKSFIDNEYIRKSIRKRKGICNYWNCKGNCGCNDCEYINKDYSCKLYTKNNPYFCKVDKLFPIDEFELNWFNMYKQCGYFWESKEQEDD